MNSKTRSSGPSPPAAPDIAQPNSRSRYFTKRPPLTATVKLLGSGKSFCHTHMKPENQTEYMKNIITRQRTQDRNDRIPKRKETNEVTLCLNLLKLPLTKYERLGGLATNNQLSHSSGGQKYQITVPTDVIPDEDPLTGLQMVAFSLRPHISERETSLVSLLIRTLY